MKKKTSILVYSRIDCVLIFVNSDVLENMKWRMEWLERRGSCAQEHPLSPRVLTTVMEHRQVNVFYVYIVAFRLSMYISPLVTRHQLAVSGSPPLPCTEKQTEVPKQTLMLQPVMVVCTPTQREVILTLEVFIPKHWRSNSTTLDVFQNCYLAHPSSQSSVTRSRLIYPEGIRGGTAISIHVWIPPSSWTVLYFLAELLAVSDLRVKSDTSVCKVTLLSMLCRANRGCMIRLPGCRQVRRPTADSLCY